jgi:hypothetical protein
MLPWVLGFLGVFGLCVVLVVRQALRAGPRVLEESALRAARTLVRRTRAAPGPGWEQTGSCTETRGLDLRFESDDDPEARARLFAPDSGGERARSTLANALTVTLTDRFATHHVHTAGSIFHISLRGTGGVVGKQVRLMMAVDARGAPCHGRIENDDDTDAAVGDWIEVEWAELALVAAGEHVDPEHRKAA